MPVASVAIHDSQFPEAVRKELLHSLQTRQVNHKFLYDSLKQTQKWLALHQAYSPSRTDPDCAIIYDRSFSEAVRRINAPQVHLVGLGCGGGQKDARLLTLLHRSGKLLRYTPSDVSTAMVLVARQTAMGAVPGFICSALVCDLATATDLPAVLEQLAEADPSTGPEAAGQATGADSPPAAFSSACRLFTFFGMIPNFEPEIILDRLASLVRAGDLLLFGANLAPGPDYAIGVQRVLPLYDNELTREWLLSFLVDLGVEKEDGDLRFTIEPSHDYRELLRIAAYFHFNRPRTILLDGIRFEFRGGESIRLFFSYRHTPALIHSLLDQHGLQVLEQWVTASEEEGVFLVTTKA
jgi:L-histidine Nalpha-methyltransferase